MPASEIFKRLIGGFFLRFYLPRNICRLLESRAEDHVIALLQMRCPIDVNSPMRLISIFIRYHVEKPITAYVSDLYFIGRHAALAGDRDRVAE